MRQLIAIVIGLCSALGCSTTTVDPPVDGSPAQIVLPRFVVMFAADTVQFRSQTSTGIVADTWRVVDGPGSISSTGLYTAPTTLSADSIICVIEAGTASKSTKPATARITLLRDTTSRVCYERDVKTITRASCALAQCHDAASRQNGYDFTRDASTQLSVFAGEPSASPMYQRITTSDEEKRMPRTPRPRLTTDDIDVIRRWIEQGARITTCASANPCDTAGIRYSTTIRTIMLSYCTVCHEGARPDNRNVVLSTYEGVKDVAVSGQLLGSVRHGPGYTPMPGADTKIPDCDILRILMWIDAGSPDN